MTKRGEGKVLPGDPVHRHSGRRYRARPTRQGHFRGKNREAEEQMAREVSRGAACRGLRCRSCVGVQPSDSEWRGQRIRDQRAVQ